MEVSAALCTTQFVPLARQTGEPFTKMAEAFKVEPLALLKPSHTVEVTAPNVALFEFNVLMVPLVASKFESVEVPTTVKVEVTVELEPTKPPYNWRVVVENDPRAVTDASVSTSANKYAGQFVPLVRHTVWPPMVSALNVPLFAFNCVVEAIPETNRLVVVTFTPVPFVNVRLPRAEVPVTVIALKMPWPRTVKVEVTVELAPTKPPYSRRVEVAKAPRAVTLAKVSISAGKAWQFVPFARHTGWPFTKTAEAFKVEPEAVANPSQAVEVTEPTVRFEIAPVLALMLEPLAVAKPSQTVLVPCPKTNLLEFRVLMVPLVASKFESVEVPTTVNVLVTVEEAPTNPPYKSKVEVAKAPRAVTEANVSVSASRYAGQLVPLVKQTVEPPTVNVPNVPLFAFNCVVDAIPLTNKLVAVAFVAVTFCKFVPPSTESVLETTKVAVEVPPAKTIEFVVVLPVLVTVWKFGVVPLGQLVPSARHTG